MLSVIGLYKPPGGSNVGWALLTWGSNYPLAWEIMPSAYVRLHQRGGGV